MALLIPVPAMHLTPPPLSSSTLLGMRLHELNGGETTCLVPHSCPTRICHATRSPDIRMMWPSHRSRRWRMVVPIWHCCVRRSNSSVLMPSLRHTPSMLRRYRLWRTSSRCCCEGVKGLCSIQQNRKHQAAKYPHFGVGGDVPAAPELCNLLHCCTCCYKSPAAFLVEAAVRAEVAAQVAKCCTYGKLMPGQGTWPKGGGL
jgi:hypothetical protein